MLKPLAEVVEPGSDFFVEDIALTAIVFDADDDDVTLWVTTVFDEELHFFHLAASFADLSTLLRLAGERGAEIDLEVANALSGDSDDTAPADGTEPAENPAQAATRERAQAADEAADRDADEEDDDDDDEDDDDDLHPTLLEFVTDERPPVLLPGVALKLGFTYTDETDTEAAFNIFVLEGIYLHLS